MVYRNGFREYALAALIFGGAMGIVTALVHQDALGGLIIGVFAGVLFALLLYLFVKLMEKKFDKKRLEIAGERRIICDGGATLQGNGGWLFLTENHLEFYPHKINLSTEEIRIPLILIRNVRLTGNRLEIATGGALVFSFVVAKKKEWLREIEEILALRKALPEAEAADSPENLAVLDSLRAAMRPKKGKKLLLVLMPIVIFAVLFGISYIEARNEYQAELNDAFLDTFGEHEILLYSKVQKDRELIEELWILEKDDQLHLAGSGTPDDGETLLAFPYIENIRIGQRYQLRTVVESAYDLLLVVTDTEPENPDDCHYVGSFTYKGRQLWLVVEDIQKA